MRALIILSLLLAVAGCAPDGGEPVSTSAQETQKRTAADKGGTITIGEETWSVVPAVQCSIYPGNIVSIAGHAAENSALEIVIDYGGPTGVRVGDDGSPESWRALRDTLEVEISGQRVRGTASFSQGLSSTAETVEGSFDVTC